MPFISTPEWVGRTDGLSEGHPGTPQIKFGEAGLALLPEIEAGSTNWEKLETILDAIEPRNSWRPPSALDAPILMPSFSPETLARIAAAGLDPERLPRHVAVIMDGNGRWARQRGMPRVEGHLPRRPVGPRTVEECCRLGIEQLTLYCLSSENWKRPQHELDFLMTLLHKYLLDERAEIMGQNIRFTVIGRRTGLPDNVLAEIDENIRVSSHNTGMILALAINYGGRTEIVDAVRAIAEQVRHGELDPDAIDEDDDQRRPVHGRHARPGPADPHGRRDARQQLPAVANLLRRTVGDGEVLARLRPRHPAPGAARLRPARTPLRRAQGRLTCCARGCGWARCWWP